MSEAELEVVAALTAIAKALMEINKTLARIQQEMVSANEIAEANVK